MSTAPRSEGYTLALFGPESERIEYTLEIGEFTVGRDASCSISLSDNSISRRHLILRVVASGVLLEDTSANGSLVDGVLIKRKIVALNPDSVIRLGAYELRLVPGADPLPSTIIDEEAVGMVGDQGVAGQHQPPGGEHPAHRQRAQGQHPHGQPAHRQHPHKTAPPSQGAPYAGSAPGPDFAQAQSTIGMGPPQGMPEPPVDQGQQADTSKVSAEVRRKLHRSLVDHLDLIKLERSRLNPRLLRAKVELALREIVVEFGHIIPRGTNTDLLVRELADEAVGLGPLEELLADDAVSEIMVVDPSTIYIEKGGRMQLTPSRFTDNESLRSTLERIIMPLGRRIDESAPMLDARLPDGSRVNAVIPPLATRGPCITIRKFAKKPLGMENLLAFGSINKRMSVFLERAVKARKNIVVAGGTGSGKTTLLNILSSACSESERIVTIEDSAELQLQQSHVVTLEARPANMEGKGEVSIRDLVKNAMRMRPDRVIVGECRGGEALDMLLAMNTGHDGSMTTTHANSPQEALRRIESLALMSGVDLPGLAIREQIAYAVDLLVHQTRFSDGSRRVTSITEVCGIEDGHIETREIFGYRRSSTSEVGDVGGEFFATGYLPSFLTDFLSLGIIRDGDTYL